MPSSSNHDARDAPPEARRASEPGDSDVECFDPVGGEGAAVRAAWERAHVQVSGQSFGDACGAPTGKTIRLGNETMFVAPGLLVIGE